MYVFAHGYICTGAWRMDVKRKVYVEISECSVWRWRLLLWHSRLFHSQVVKNSCVCWLVFEAVVEAVFNEPFMVPFPWIHRLRKRRTWTLKQKSHVCPEKGAAFGLPTRTTYRPAEASGSTLEWKKKACGSEAFVLVSPHWLSKRMSSSGLYCTLNVCPGCTITSP